MHEICVVFGPTYVTQNYEHGVVAKVSCYTLYRGSPPPHTHTQITGKCSKVQIFGGDRSFIRSDLRFVVLITMERTDFWAVTPCIVVEFVSEGRPASVFRVEE
jgi:hypothetical protein